MSKKSARPVCPYVCSTSSVSEYVYLPPALSDSGVTPRTATARKIGHPACLNGNHRVNLQYGSLLGLRYGTGPSGTVFESLNSNMENFLQTSTESRTVIEGH